MRVLVVIGTVRSCNVLDLPARCPKLAHLYRDAQVGDVGRAIRFDACLGRHMLGCHVDTSCNMLDLPARCPELAHLYGDAQVADIGLAIRFDACLGRHMRGCHVDTSCNMLYIVCLRNIESL